MLIPLRVFNRWRTRSLIVLVLLMGRENGVSQPTTPASQSPSEQPQLDLQIGHIAEATVVAFSPDRKTLASASHDRTVKVWDAATGQLLRTLSGHTAPVLAIGFGDDGKTILSGSRDGTVRMWSTPSGKLLRTLTELPASVTAVAFSPDGKRLAGSYADKTVKLWNVETGRLETTLEGHLKNVKALAFAHDGKIVASGSEDGMVKLWDIADGTLQRTLMAHAMPIHSIDFSRDGTALAVGSEDGGASLWNVSTGKLERRLTVSKVGERVKSVAFSPDGEKLATGGQTGVKLWNARTGDELFHLRSGGFVSAVAFSPDGRTVIGGIRDGTLQQINAQSGAIERVLGRAAQVFSIALSPGVLRPESTQSGRMLASANYDGTVKLWDAGTGRLLRSLVGHTDLVKAVAFSPDGRLVASGGKDQTARLWDARTGKLLRTLSGHSSSVNAVAFAPDGRMLASGDEDWSLGKVRLWDVTTGRLLRTFTESSGMVNSVAFSPDGKLLAAGSGNWSGGELTMWEAQTGKVLLREYSPAVRAVAFAPSGKVLASGSAALDESGEPVGDIVKLWNTQTGALQRTLTQPTPDGWVNSIAFSADGKLLATGSRDNMVRLWEPRAGVLLRTLSGHLGGVTAVSFSPEAPVLSSASLDSTIKQWQVGGVSDQSPSSGRLLVTLLTLPPGDEKTSADWLALSPEGYYDGSAGAGRFMQWRVGSDLFPVEAYERTFHRPDLIRKALQSHALTETPEAHRFASGQAIPPQIAFVTPREGQQVAGETVAVEVTTTDDQAVQRIEVLVNGRPAHAKPLEVGAKPLDVGAKPLEVGAKPIPAGHKTAQQFRTQVTLPAGQADITLAALAFDNEELHGRTELHLTRSGTQASSGDLYVLAVGVSQYRDSKLNLKYAARDAAAFADLWKRAEGSLYRRVVVTRLSDEQATAPNVRAALFKLLETATNKDSVILFLSGHGAQVTEGEYYFATNEVDASSSTRLAETALPWTVFLTTLAKLDAKRVSLFLDACHSGNALGGQQASNDSLAGVLIKRAGVLVFASSRGEEYSYELDNLQQGAFTAALQEGLGEGKANFEVGGRRDGTITAEELLAYLRARVPQLTDNRQTPACPLLRDFGESFPLIQAR